MQDAATHTLTHAQALATTAAASTAAGTLWETIGIGPAVLFMALAGTAMGLLFSPPGGSRVRLFALAVIYTVVSAALAVLLAEFLDFAAHKFDSLLALVLAFCANSALPALRVAINTRLKTTIGGQVGDAGDMGNGGGIDDGLDASATPRGRRQGDGFGGTWKGD